MSSPDMSAMGLPSENDADLDSDNIEELIELNERNYQPASTLQKLLDRASDQAGRPTFVIILSAAVGAWVGYNLLASHFGLLAFERPPFDTLELLATVAGLLLAAIIIATQRREDRLADRRAQITLQLALRAERKSAKIIKLLEEMRRDSPHLADRFDAESEAMSAPLRPDALIEKIERDSTNRSP